MAFKDQSTIPKATFIERGVYTFLLNRCIHTFIEIGVYTRIAHLSLKVRLGHVYTRIAHLSLKVL